MWFCANTQYCLVDMVQHITSFPFPIVGTYIKYDMPQICLTATIILFSHLIKRNEKCELLKTWNFRFQPPNSLTHTHKHTHRTPSIHTIIQILETKWEKNTHINPHTFFSRSDGGFSMHNMCSLDNVKCKAVCRERQKIKRSESMLYAVCLCVSVCACVCGSTGMSMNQATQFIDSGMCVCVTTIKVTEKKKLGIKNNSHPMKEKIMTTFHLR